MDRSLAIIVPLYNKLELTQACVASILAVGLPESAELVLVDNGSTDGTAEWGFALDHPRIRFVRSQRNLDFAGGCHLGVDSCGAERLVFLNNDTEVRDGWLDFVRHLDDPGVGAAGCLLLYPDGSTQHGGVAIGADAIGFHVHAGAAPEDARVSQVRCVQAVTAACMAMRRDTWAALGGFDRAYRNGAEDVDLCLRVRAAGLDIVYDPGSVVVHHESQSDGRFQWAADNIARYLASWRNRVVPDATTFDAWPEVGALGDDLVDLDDLQAPGEANRRLQRGIPRTLRVPLRECAGAGTAPYAVDGTWLVRAGGFDVGFATLDAAAVDLVHRVRLWGARTDALPWTGGGAFPIPDIDDPGDARRLQLRWGTCPPELRLPVAYEPFVTAPMVDGQLSFEHREQVVLVPCDDEAGAAQVERALRRWGPDDAVTVVVRADDGDDHAMRLLDAAADAASVDDALPDVVVVAGGDDADPALVRHAAHVVPVGRDRVLLASLARACGVPASVL